VAGSAHYSLLELNQYIRQTIALNFEEALWIQAEIAQISFSGRHVYLDLWQKDEEDDDVVAQAAAVIWANKLSFIRRKLGDLFHDILAPGVSVLIRVKPEFHERYGLKLLIEDLDPSYTLGKLAVQREQVLAQLAKNNLLNANASLDWPTVIRKVAILASETSAGYQDFVEQILENEYGYEYQMTLYPMAVQGMNVGSDLAHQLGEIHMADLKYDVIVLIRGGGSKMDLAAFDSYDVGELIAHSDLPVITGIGHERDQSIADIVSAVQVKTPTAAADYIINHTARYEQELIDLYQEISTWSRQIIHREDDQLNFKSARIEDLGISIIHGESSSLALLNKSINFGAQLLLQKHRSDLDRMSTQLIERDPQRILDRGYSLTLHQKQIVTKSTDLQQGDQITTLFADGKIHSTIN